MSDCLTDIGGVTSTKCKLVHHFGSQFTSKGSFEGWNACFQFSCCKSYVTFDQNVKNAISAEFGILAVSLPDWWFLRTKGVIGTFSQTVKAGIF